MEDCKSQPGMLTYSGECGDAPAGLGSAVYVCRAEDLTMADGRPLPSGVFSEIDLADGALHKIDLTDDGGGLTGERKGGFSVSATMTLDDQEVSSELRRLLNPRVRLPRREKKRRLNNVMRHLQLKATVLLLSSYSPRTGQMLALSLLFPDKLPMRVEVFGQRAFAVSETQAWLLRLLTRRLWKNLHRILFREGGLKLVGRTTADGDASAEVVVSRQQAECIRRMLALEELDRREHELLSGGEGTGNNF